MSTPAWVDELSEVFLEYSEALQHEEWCAKQLATARDRREASWGRIQALARKVAMVDK
jgi:hypothetical protein